MKTSFISLLAVVAVRSAAGAGAIPLPLPPAGERAVVPVTPTGSTATVTFDVPVSDIQLAWRPNGATPVQTRKWRLSVTSFPMDGVPCLVFFNMAERNRFFIGTDALDRDCEIVSRINQEKGVFNVSVTVSSPPGAPTGPFRVTLDRRDVPWTDALAGWREALPYPKGTYPDAAWNPVYCTWYAVHAALTQAWVERTARIAAGLGIGTFILDDGWSYDDAKRVNPDTLPEWYRDTGTWDVFSKKKFPDFSAHRERMRATGMKYLVWVAPYFVGTRAAAYTRWGARLADQKPFEGNVLADLSHAPMTDEVNDQLVRLVETYDLDGLKIDFLNARCPATRAPYGVRALTYVEGLMARLRRAKPDGLFEFCQGYSTPLTARLATQFRAGDVPFEWLPNLLRIAGIRLVMGDGVPIHSDPICWAASETPDNVSRHFIAAMAGVPMLSMDLEKMPRAHRDDVRAWLGFYARHVRRFQQEGRWRVVYRNGGIAFVAATAGDDALVIVNDPASAAQAARTVGARRTVLLNLAWEPVTVNGVTAAPADTFPRRF